MAKNETACAMVRAEWPDATDARIAALEAYAEHAADELGALAAHVARLDAALRALDAFFTVRDKAVTDTLLGRTSSVFVPYPGILAVLDAPPAPMMDLRSPTGEPVVPSQLVPAACGA